MQQWFSALPPELQNMIFSHLDQNTLTNCARVSKSWNILATPLLWRTVNVKTCEQLEILLQDKPRQAMYRNACNIHSLTLCLDHWKLLSALVPQYFGVRIYAHCSNIRDLEVRCAGHPISTPAKALDVVAAEKEEVKTLMALIRWNPRLTSLSFHSGIVSPTLLLMATSETLGLQSLYIGMSMPIFVARDVLNSLPSSIQSVTMNLSEFSLEEILTQDEETEQEQEQEQDEETHQNVNVPKEKPSKPHKALETLKIYGSFSLLEHFLFLPFLETCSSKLTHLECPEARFFFDQDVNAALARLGHFLELLGQRDLPNGTDSTDAEIAELILVHPRLRSINLEGCKNAATLTAEAILDTCEGYLRELHIGGCRNISSKDLQAILCKARQLEKLVAIDKGNILLQNPILLAKDIIASVWATSCLKHFECRIIVDPESHKWTRKVYQQLGAQSHLERLILGHPLDPVVNYPPFQLDCLDLTLESGLEELEGLVKLQELSVMSLAHGIGVPELEWMVRHWLMMKKHHMFYCHVPFVRPGACRWISKNRTV
ncbi:hypothetical protein BGZ81_006623 [Podila clonocystis]|nr:hypothetical protein BGZ81_006623 [Podila clonocystis]